MDQSQEILLGHAIFASSEYGYRRIERSISNKSHYKGAISPGGRPLGAAVGILASATTGLTKPMWQYRLNQTAYSHATFSDQQPRRHVYS